jgi:predicted transcriptional regulator of viral defense system
MTTKKTSLREYLEHLQSSGKYWFKKEEARSAIGANRSSFTRTLSRWEKKQRIAKAKRGFYVVIPPEYSKTGMLPPDWFVSQLMEFIGQPYYVGLLSAAAIHGAAHQQPMEYQVVVPTAERTITVGPVKIHFFKKSGMKSSSVIDVKTPTGYIKISDPALTAIDLVAYSKQVGGLDRVAMVIAELKRRIRSESIMIAARHELRFAFVQRVGWLLEQMEARSLTRHLHELVLARNPRYIPLDPEAPTSGCVKNSRWKVIENAKLDLDI